MQAASDAVPSGMVSILGLERPQVEALCEKAAQGDVLEVANLLCPGQHRRLRNKGRLRASRRDGR